jgi:hypothetical protein
LFAIKLAEVPQNEAALTRRPTVCWKNHVCSRATGMMKSDVEVEFS